eukprot:COSAG01_NODE_3106_length_6575_cov_25.785207_7_plen_304_part_01
MNRYFALLKMALLLTVLTATAVAQCPGGKAYTDPSCKGVAFNDPTGAQIVADVKAFVGLAKGKGNFPAATQFFGSKLGKYSLQVEPLMPGLTKFTTDALKGTGSFSRPNIISGRKEACQKGTMNGLLSGMTILTARKAAAMKPGAAQAKLWAQASSMYFGYKSTVSSAPAATAEKRAKNYNTGGTPAGMQITLAQARKYGKNCGGCYSMVTHKVQCNTKCGTTPATQNQKIFDAFKTGPSAATVNIIEDQIMITYIQASLRYLNKMDKDNAKAKPVGMALDLATAKRYGKNCAGCCKCWPSTCN